MSDDFDGIGNGGQGVVELPPGSMGLGTSFGLRSGDGAKFDATPPFKITVFAPGLLLPQPGLAEVIEVTAMDGDTVTDCVRGAEPYAGSSDLVAITKGWQVSNALTAGTLKKIQDAASSGGGGGGGAVASVNDQTGAVVLAAEDIASSDTYETVIAGLSGVQAVWRFGEASGTSIADVVGGFTATLAGGVTLGETGFVSDGSTSATFNGSSGVATVPNHTALHNFSEWTIVAWIRRSGDIAQYGAVMGDVNGFANEVNYMLAFEISAAGANCLEAGFWESGTWYTAAVGTPLTKDEDHLIVATWDGTTISIWDNGLLVAQNAPGGIAPLTSGSTTLMGSGYAGAHAAITLGWVGLGNTAISADDVAALYAARVDGEVVTANKPLPSSLIGRADGQVLGGPNIVVTDNHVWLQDPTNPNGACDNTGSSYVNEALRGAILRAMSAPGGGQGFKTFASAPGLLKYDSSDPVFIPAGLIDATPGLRAVTLHMPSDTGQGTVMGICGATSALATTLVVNNISGDFPDPTVMGRPVLAVAVSSGFTYTGVTHAGSGTSRTATLTGCAPLSYIPGSGIPGIGSVGLVVAGAPLQTGDLSPRGSSLLPAWYVQGPGGGSWRSSPSEVPPTDAMDGPFVWGGAGCSVSGFRFGLSWANDHELFKGDSWLTGNWAAYASLAPKAFWDQGGQTFEGGDAILGNIWCTFYVAPFATLETMTVDNLLAGFCPVFIQKGPTSGVSTVPISSGGNVWRNLQIEGLGLTLVASDGTATLTGDKFIDGGIGWEGALPDGYSQKVGLACPFNGVSFDGFGGLQGIATGDPFTVWKADLAIGRMINGALPMATMIAGRKPQILTSGYPIVRVDLDEGVVTAGQSADINAGDLVTVNGYVNADWVQALHNVPAGVASVISGTIHGVAAAAEDSYLPLYQNDRPGFVPVNVHQRATPPTSPSATTSGTTGTRGAGVHYYRQAALLSGGGVTAASTEVSVTIASGQSAVIASTNPTAPHGQTIIGLRTYVATSSGGQVSAFDTSGSALATVTDTGQSLSTTSPTTNNVGCEIFFPGSLQAVLVRDNSAESPGTACTASGPGDTGGVLIGMASKNVGGSQDNGVHGLVLLSLK